MKYLLSLGLFFFIQLSFSQYSDLEYINSGTAVTNEITFAVGEIFVIENTERENKEESPTLKISAVPNPSYDTVYLQMEGEFSTSYVEVYDFTGRLVQKVAIEDRMVNLAQFSTGIYIIRSPINEFSPIRILKL